jgi:predicted CXXCH cytochrome family protein
MSNPSPQSVGKRPLRLGLALLLLTAGCARETPPPLPAENPRPHPLTAFSKDPIQLAQGRHLSVWWDALPDEVRNRSVPSGEESNVHPADYRGPDACRQCHLASHEKNYLSWSEHSHRWMNALANPSTVRGDFSAGASMFYRGGRADFVRQGDDFFMNLQRGRQRRSYRITQTIGSRFFQYYVGKQIDGPEPKDHHFYSKDHVLPFGYWLAQKEWVPVIHIGREVEDAARPDPFAPPDHGPYYAEYSASCNTCHTTFPLADLFGRRTRQMGAFAPTAMHFSMRGYLEEAHPDLIDPKTGMMAFRGATNNSTHRQVSMTAAVSERTAFPGEAGNPMHGWEASRYAATLGVSCEACHLGSRQHIDSEGQVPPRFSPASPYLRFEAAQAPPSAATHDNVNWACGRCHVGPRPQFAGGMATWNSVEYSDAMRGSCYSKLRCIDCHNPHRAIGPTWSQTADRDDAVCLKCHQQYQPDDRRLQHTHHPIGSEGARCMNCHVPRINEGIEDVVRTHTIYSPTRADMIEANHPNACNLCHTDKPIDWTLRVLKHWYGKTYDEARIAANYPKRDRPVGLGWLDSKNESVRLVAVEAMTRRRDFFALPRLLDALDDPYLVNRQFAYKGLQEMLNVRLSDFGYRFYASRDERRKPLADLRARFVPAEKIRK